MAPPRRHHLRLALALVVLALTCALPGAGAGPGGAETDAWAGAGHDAGAATGPGLATPAASPSPSPSARVHGFYYLWYGNPATDGRWLHWDHSVLPHWNEQTRAQFPHGGPHRPPAEVHSPFYPARGCYSSRDPATLDAHLAEAAEAGIGVLVLSWWGPAWRGNTSDSQGVNTDEVVGLVFAAAERAAARAAASNAPMDSGGPGPLSRAPAVQLALHLEPYPGRSAASVREDLVDVLTRFGASPALFRHQGRPVVYVYDSYHIPPNDWARVLGPAGSLRGTPHDPFALGLWLGAGDGPDLAAAGFDGFYSYFASEQVSYGADPTNWPSMARFAEQRGLLFSASIGPGYDDTRIRPWNGAATRPREARGARYWRAWEAALGAGAGWVSITSFNEWGEGTQIEPAAPAEAVAERFRGDRDDPGRDHPDRAIYLDYGEAGPRLYYELTARGAATLERRHAAATTGASRVGGEPRHEL